MRYGLLRSTRRPLYTAYGVYREPDGPMQLDYFFWVVRNTERMVLVDTGFDPEVGRRRGRELVCDPVTALARLGVDRDAVTDIVLTHFHCDHIGQRRTLSGRATRRRRERVPFWTGEYASRPVAAAAVGTAEGQVLVRAGEKDASCLFRACRPRRSGP